MNRSSRSRAAAPLVVVTVLAWSCSAIAQTADPVDPPPSVPPAAPTQVQDTPSVVVDTPVVVIDEATGQPIAPVPVPPPAAAPAPTPAPDAPGASPSTPTPTTPHGADAWTTGLAQWGTGLGIELLILGAGSIPVVGCVPQCLAPCMGPFVVGIGEVGVGNAIGRRTGGWVWPVVGLFGARLALSVATTSLTFALLQREYVALFEAVQTQDQTRVNSAQRALLDAEARNWPALVGTAVGAAVLASAVPAVVYAFSAVDKGPGEAGAIAVPPPFAEAPKTAPSVSASSSPDMSSVTSPVTQTMAW